MSPPPRRQRTDLLACCEPQFPAIVVSCGMIDEGDCRSVWRQAYVAEPACRLMQNTPDWKLDLIRSVDGACYGKRPASRGPGGRHDMVVDFQGRAAIHRYPIKCRSGNVRRDPTLEKGELAGSRNGRKGHPLDPERP